MEPPKSLFMTEGKDEPYSSSADEKKVDGIVNVAVLDPSESLDYVEGEEDTTNRKLTARMVTMIATGGAIGSGLIIGSGSALTKAGPVGLLIGYSLVGLICYVTLTALGEVNPACHIS